MEKTIPQTSNVRMRRSQIRLADYNPRAITAEGKEYLRKSILRYGVVGGIVVNVRTNTLVGGHQKIAILDEIKGYDRKNPLSDYTLDVSVVDVDAKTEKELNITLNNPKVGGYWDRDKMLRLLPDIDTESVGLSDEDFKLMGISVGDEESVNVIPDIKDSSHTSKSRISEQEEEPEESYNNLVATAKIKSAWGQGAKHIEPRCDLQEKISLLRRNDRIYLHSFKTGKEGIPLADIKTKDNVELFAEAALKIIHGFTGEDCKDWKIVCAPKRRHPVWNFAEEVCRMTVQLGGLEFIPNMFTVASKSRLDPGVIRLKPKPKGNVFLYDDIMTTGMTMKAMEEELQGCNLIRIIGINNG